MSQYDNPNPMVQCYGFGPENAKCKTCEHLIVHRPGQNKYHKCKFRKLTNSPRTDHKVRWDACSKYQTPSRDE